MNSYCQFVARGAWRCDRPARPGWYNASLHNHPREMRWWDGRRWSTEAFPFCNAKRAARAAERKVLGAFPWRPLLPGLK